MLIMRNAIETIGGSELSRLEYLRHKGAHQSAEMDLGRTARGRRAECDSARRLATDPGTQFSARNRGTAKMTEAICRLETLSQGKVSPD